MSLQATAFPGRPYELYVPASVRAARSADAGAPVIVALHGFGGDGSGLVAYFHLKAVADAHGALVVAPPGSRNPDGSSYWNAGGACCDLYDERPDDVAYLDAVLDDVAARYAVDEGRVYVVGHSNGGFMAYWYACKRSERVAAIVSLAGEALSDTAACTPKAPVAVLQIQGDADEIVPYDGGNLGSPEVLAVLRRHHFRLPPDGIHASSFAGARGSASEWAAWNGCGPLTDDAAPLDLDVRVGGAETSVASAKGCKGGAAELWTIHGGTHVPSLPSSFGETVFGFLRAHPKAPTPGRSSSKD
jgi:polyhydroxybutyrate depolymerase